MRIATDFFHSLWARVTKTVFSRRPGMRKTIFVVGTLVVLLAVAYFTANTILQPVVAFGFCGGVFLESGA